MLIEIPLFEITDVELANSFFTDKIMTALDRSATLTRIQNRRKKFSSWLSEDT